MIKLRVVTITNDLEKYPQYLNDTKEFSDYTLYIEDEVETFIIDTRDGGFWPASDFFDIANISHFFVDSSETPE